MDTDLHYIIHSKQRLGRDHLRYFLYQIVRGVKAIHSAGVLHRDLKPGNILVNRDCNLRICDFGLARGVDPSEPTPMLTEYVVTRWYRAPELLVASSASYGGGIDMWSVGCIFAEMLGRKPLFQGRDALQQLRLIVQTLGVSASELEWIPHAKAVEFISAMGFQPAVEWAATFPEAGPSAAELLGGFLAFDPAGRITASAALEHAYFGELHQLNTEPEAPRFCFGFEHEGVTGAELREMMSQQCARFGRTVPPPPPPLLTSPMPSSRLVPPETPERWWCGDGGRGRRDEGEGLGAVADFSTRGKRPLLDAMEQRARDGRRADTSDDSATSGDELSSELRSRRKLRTGARTVHES